MRAFIVCCPRKLFIEEVVGGDSPIMTLLALLVLREALVFSSYLETESEIKRVAFKRLV